MARGPTPAHRTNLSWGHRLRILVHDYAGHPFQIQLSRALAERRLSDSIRHHYSAEFVGGKGDLEPRDTDPPNLSIQSVATGRPFNRYRARSRLLHEWQYAKVARAQLRAFDPDVVVYSNVPLLAHFLILIAFRGPRIIFWHQDIYSAAIGDEARQRLGALGSLIAWTSDRVERSIARRSRVVVPIADSFLAVYRRWRLPERKIVVHPNWAPLIELPVLPRDNDWSERHGLVGGLNVTYSGTLGLKHRPEALVRLAEHVGNLPNSDRVVVVSEGRGRDFLESELSRHPSLPLLLFDFQPFTDLPAMLGAADVFVALLEPNASRYSVPSKILSYMCAGRPIVALVPDDNQAASTILAADCGFVVSNEDDLNSRVEQLLRDEVLREQQGRNARRYAEEVFDIDRIAAKWTDIIDNAYGRP